MCTSFEHQSVLLPETIQFLTLKSGAKVLDGTFGLGGHAKSILECIGSTGKYYAFDLDKENLEEAKKRLKDYDSQLTTFHDNFAHCQNRLESVGVTHVDAILLDLGLSSPHVDDAVRGFSVLKEGPLDMRFDRSQGETAADIVNHWSYEDLRQIFYEYGEEKYAPKIARLIIEQRDSQPFETTSDLVDLIGTIMKSSGDQRRTATRVFQALRIAVNEELTVLEETLPIMLSLLAPKGRMVVISYHSLEDRIVKHAFKEVARSCVCPRELPRCECSGKASYKILTKKPITSSETELVDNPRSRSAKLRVIERLTL
ncbi:MAG: 16S rRNA (cytosine(1402)-N(4))-methyltransferase RsmH [Candidatus Peregrinibacteria bacterium]|nr:16S rRNA (cytosine(1402)-N(4))-methyltransferase RsmH [Candidatus Peregrinibacteria bacterium]